MDRLTIPGFKFDADYIASHLQSWPIAQALNRLSAYEDTNLTPAEIAAMREELAAMGAENDMLKDTMIRACVWLDVHGRPGIPDVTRTLSEAVAATVKKEAHNEP